MGYPITYTLQNPMVLWYSFLLVWWFITANSKNCCALRCFQQPISRCGILASRGLWNSWHNGCTAAACSILRFIDGECESVQCTQCTQVYPPVFRMQRRAWGNQAGNGGVKTHTGFAWKLVTQNAVNDHVPCKNDQVWGVLVHPFLWQVQSGKSVCYSQVPQDLMVIFVPMKMAINSETIPMFRYQTQTHISLIVYHMRFSVWLAINPQILLVNSIKFPFLDAQTNMFFPWIPIKSH